jgi:hypothetical protein
MAVSYLLMSNGNRIELSAGTGRILLSSSDAPGTSSGFLTLLGCGLMRLLMIFI